MYYCYFINFINLKIKITHNILIKQVFIDKKIVFTLLFLYIKIKSLKYKDVIKKVFKFWIKSQ